MTELEINGKKVIIIEIFAKKKYKVLVDDKVYNHYNTETEAISSVTNFIKNIMG